MKAWAATLPIALLVAVALAGCSDGKKATPGTDEDPCTLEPALCDPDSYLADHHCLIDDVRPRVYAPDTPGPDLAASPWVQGDFWTYDVQAEARSFTSTLVYYEDIDFANGAAQHYLVGSASRDEAFDHALFSINPMLGRIHRTLYSPHESGLHADMFHFPLCEGSRWTTQFYDTTFDLTAHLATLALPAGGSDPLGFRIDGTSPDGSSLTLTYSPTVQWFTSLELVRADGLTLTMDLTAHGHGKDGTFYFLRAQRDEQLDLSRIPNNGVSVARENGGEGPYDQIGVWAALQRQGSGKVEVLLKDPAGAVRACIGLPGPGLGGALRAGCVDASGELKVQIPYQAGSWSVTVEKTLLDPTTITGELRLVSIYDRSGTV